MNSRRHLFCATLAAVLSFAAQACGPDFPAELLTDRAATLNKLPEGAFNFEVSRLVAATQHFKVVEGEEYPTDGSAPISARERVERAWWGDQYAKIVAAHDAPNAAAAYAVSAGLPEEARRYQAGAAAYTKHDWLESRTRFRSVLDLPVGERTHYGIWAQYMLGKIAAELNLDERNNDADAIASFSGVREQVAKGADDPYGLAAASFGEEARVHLKAGRDVEAIGLYAQQAAQGSSSGRASLLQVARAVIKDPVRLNKLVHEPLGQRLMTAYLFTRSGELNDAAVDGESAPQDIAKSQAAGQQRIEQFLAAVERNGLDKVAGVDRLAALAYRSGKYDLAAKLAVRDDSGLNAWVRAKLALRNGDANAAAQAYAQAARAFPADEEWSSGFNLDSGEYETMRPQTRIEGERGTLALSRGEYVAAMEHLYNAASIYWPDTAYVAERVLSIDELKSFVDAHVAKAPTKAKPTTSKEADGAYGVPAESATALRALLARRLLRADRYDEALAYFDEPALQAKAKTYVEARRAAIRGDRIEQAQALFTAAKSARLDGIDLIGFELDPDYQMYDGNFDLGGVDPGVSNTDASGADATIAAAVNRPAPPRKDLIAPKALAGPDEAARVAASRAVPLERFHYRYTAVDLASKSADLLPPRTQAFAAVLCRATGWLIDRDPPAADKLYTRYLKQGPYVAWAANFGRECPEPDFVGAALRLHAERVAWWKHVARHHAPYAAIAIGLLLFVIWLWRRRRGGERR